MDTAHIREGIRKMRFSTILDRWDSGEMTQETAAELLGMSVRSFQRWRERYEADGEAGLVDRRGAPSPRRAPEEEVERMLGLYRDKYADFTVRHFHEQLTKRHNYTLGYTVTKLAQGRAGQAGAQALGAPQEAAAPADARHDAASGRVAARVGRGQALDGPDRHHGRRHERDLLDDPR